MERAAEELRFEQAALLRDRLKAIELLGKRQKVVSGALADTDVVGFHRGAAKSCFVVLHYLDGELAAKDMELLESPPGEEAEGDIVAALVKQYYNGRGVLPRQILLPCETEEEILITRMLSEAAGRRVQIITPQRGAKMELIRLANLNGAEEVERATTREERRSRLLEALGKLLDLPEPPRRIEAFDISNTGASDIVSSMTVFQDARPLKRDYRRFIIKEITGPDDYAAMAETLRRRFRRYGEGDEKFSARPDLLLIDGGAGHVSTAVGVLRELGLDIPAYGMVKDGRHRTHALVSPQGQLVGIQFNPALFALIGQIQEETHRFAIEFHRARRARSTRASVLDEIPGIGEGRKAALLKQFKSLKAIRGASLEELEAVVPKPAARAVYDYFREE
ncbi:UvrABC system protein C [bioreactor metagenome]|uniref:UvrABC system protein C n=1 Tax=bioreactor metagenome TaxID=1076179 RepID=A0A645BI58_9ZZZZ